MGKDKSRRIVILGGGTAGWMSAAGLSAMLDSAGHSITLVESEAIGIVGVGEATLPHLRFFNERIGVDEREFLAATNATIKLGIEFVDWGRIGDSYIHPFGEYGLVNDGLPFHQIWRRLADQAGPICDYSLPIVASRMGRFEPPSTDQRSVRSTYRYAYQFDATLFAPFLRRHAEARGVQRIEGRVTRVQRTDSGDIKALVLENGQVVEGDVFVDCSGFIGLLIEQELATGYDDWSRWLPCDRAVAAPCEHEGPLLPYTRATAREAGWQWRIPLQNRVGNGYVFASEFTSGDRAEKLLVENCEGTLLAEPRLLRFVAGKRRKAWNRNCIAIGLSGGFLEPLESTSIYLVQQGITYLLEVLPDRSARDFAASQAEYNRMMDLEFERIRDFLILHYRATTRSDSEFWNYVRTMPIPDSLTEKLELFRARGRVQTYDHGLFLEPSWLAVFLGQGIMPRAWDRRADDFPEGPTLQRMLGLKHHIASEAAAMSDHAAWLSACLGSPAPSAGLS